MNFLRQELLDALRRLLRPTDSSFTLQAAREILATVPLINSLDMTPYLQGYGDPVARFVTQPQVGGEFGYVWVRPGGDRVLQVLRVIVLNQGAAINEYNLNLLTSAEVTTIGREASLNMAYIGNGKIGMTSPNTIERGTHTNATVSVAGVDSRRLQAGDSGIFDFAEVGGIRLFGNDPSGAALAVVNTTVSDVLKAVFIGREWPLPGA